MRACGSRVLGLRSVPRCWRGSYPAHQHSHRSLPFLPPRPSPLSHQTQRYIRNDTRQDGYSREPEFKPSAIPERLAEDPLTEEDAELSANEKFAAEGWYVPPSHAGLLRAFAWTVGVGALSFAGAAYFTQRDTVDLVEKSKKAYPTPEDLAKTKLKIEMDSALEKISKAQELLPFSALWTYAKIKEWWLNLDEGKRVGAGITAVNTVVFLAWQIPHPLVRLFMTKHFTHHPLSGRYYTLLTSCFSHVALWHFGLNMYAMQNFLSATDHYISSAGGQIPDIEGDDPVRRRKVLINSGYGTLAFFITAGMVSSFGLHAIVTANLLRKMRTMPFESALASSKPIRPSLGASGAIYGTVTCTALAWPESSVNMFFAIPVPITYGTLGLMGLDVMGILRGWQMFAHEAHLAGALFGGAYFYAAPYLNSFLNPYIQLSR